MNIKLLCDLRDELRSNDIEGALWHASCHFEVIRKNLDQNNHPVWAEEILDFEQRLDALLEEIKDYALYRESDYDTE
jgi:hypothetical protein